MLQGMWDLPGPGMEPVSPALGGGFFTTEPPGKPRKGLVLYIGNGSIRIELQLGLIKKVKLTGEPISQKFILGTFHLKKKIFSKAINEKFLTLSC